MADKRILTNQEIAELLRDIAASYKLKDETKNKFRIVAYERAADAVEHASSELKDLWDNGQLDQVPGIGTSIAEHLDELFRTGKSKHFEEVMEGLPKSMFKLMEVPGIGAKTAYRLARELGIDSLSDLEKAAKKGHISKLEGFGEQSEKEILVSLEEIKGKTKRLLLPYANEIANELIEWMLQIKSVKRADPLGSLRRKVSTVGDIDIAVASEDPLAAIDHFTKFPKSQRLIERGDRTSSIVVPGSIRADLMVETPEAYGALLQHFTGSKHHNIALREYALKKNLSLSDYGIYLKKGIKKSLKKFSSEEEFYNFLGMQYVEPELREDTGEVKAALNGSLPKLIRLEDVKADLQIHSDFDIETSHDLGESSFEEIIEKAAELNYEYLAFTEHNPSQKGHTEKNFIDILSRKKEKLEKINENLKKGLLGGGKIKRAFNSLEIDITPDGSLPLSPKALELLDFALVSIHSSFRQARKEATKRVIEALASPKVKIFAHPTGRKINEREGVDLDWDQIFDFCLKNNKYLEINCDPMRLDLPDVLVREAVKLGVKLTLGTDSHHKLGLDNMIWGVSVARRGWAEKKDILNTYRLEEFEKMLK